MVTRMDTRPRTMSGSAELLREQARAYICGKLDHAFAFVLPLQTQDETREAFCECVTCHEQMWIQFPPDGYERLLKDAADGKIR